MIPGRIPWSTTPVYQPPMLADVEALEAAGFEAARHEAPVDYEQSPGDVHQAAARRYGFWGLSARSVAGRIRTLGPHVYQAMIGSLSAYADPSTRKRSER